MNRRSEGPKGPSSERPKVRSDRNTMNGAGRARQGRAGQGMKAGIGGANGLGWSLVKEIEFGRASYSTRILSEPGEIFTIALCKWNGWQPGWGHAWERGGRVRRGRMRRHGPLSKSSPAWRPAMSGWSCAAWQAGRASTSCTPRPAGLQTAMTRRGYPQTQRIRRTCGWGG